MLNPLVMFAEVVKVAVSLKIFSQQFGVVFFLRRSPLAAAFGAACREPFCEWTFQQSAHLAEIVCAAVCSRYAHSHRGRDLRNGVVSRKLVAIRPCVCVYIIGSVGRGARATALHTDGSLHFALLMHLSGVRFRVCAPYASVGRA